MTSPRKIAALSLAALAAAVVAAVPAPAAVPSHGIGGVITDADSGLALSGATVVWNGTTSPAPSATTDGSGRYLFVGLDAGSSGTLAAAGPAGWDRLDVGGITLPADGLATQHVALHRDWAMPAGGASASANDESGAGDGCGSGAAVDGDRGTGWSASATRPAGDPPVLTVALPQAIELRTLVVDPTSACGHDAGAALGAYRLETSTDGASWATAADGAFTAAHRGTAVELTPTANTAGVRYVRLVALGAQDPGAATVDVRELKVFGVGPNVAPSGTLSTEAPRNFINAVVRLRAAFTDPDSTIVRYLWDFDGDGAWDQQTLAPSAAHVWQGPGVYHVTVGARDFRGDLGTASIDLRVTDPNAPLEAVPQRKPLITFDPPSGRDLDARIACASKCRFTAKLVMTKLQARRLHAKRRTVLTLSKSTEGPGLGSWTLELPSSLIKRLRKAKLKKVTLRLTASAVDQQKRRSTVSRWVTFR
jgi:hypothetical protein